MIFPVGFCSDAPLTFTAHHTVVMHAVDSWRVAVITEWDGDPLVPSPISELTVTYPRPTLPARGDLLVSLVSADARDDDWVELSLRVEQVGSAGKEVALYSCKQKTTGQAKTVVLAAETWAQKETA
jgi:hypothetical protein